MYRPGHVRAVKIAAVSRIRMERSDLPNRSVIVPRPHYLSRLTARTLLSFQRLHLSKKLGGP